VHYGLRHRVVVVVVVWGNTHSNSIIQLIFELSESIEKAESKTQTSSPPFDTSIIVLSFLFD